MSRNIRIDPVGAVSNLNGSVFIQVDEAYRPALENIEGFSHLQVVWWGHLTDDPSYRKTLVLEQLFRKGPDRLGVFATRSPVRPNPILISTVEVTGIDREEGRIHVDGMDAESGTPVLDIKPYHRMERVRDCSVPEWCDHWPRWHEDADGFSWNGQ